MATPGKMEQYTEDQIVAALNDKITVDLAARHLQVHPQTLIRWLDKNGYRREVKIAWVKQTERPGVNSRILAL